MNLYTANMGSVGKDGQGSPAVVSFEDFLFQQDRTKSNSLNKFAKCKPEVIDLVFEENLSSRKKKSKQLPISQCLGNNLRKPKNRANVKSLDVVCLSDDIPPNSVKIKASLGSYLKSASKKNIRNESSTSANRKHSKRRGSSLDVLQAVVSKPTSTKVDSATTIKKQKLSEHLSGQTSLHLPSNETKISEPLWIEKYQPSKCSEILGNEGTAKVLVSWLHQWKKKVENEQTLEQEVNNKAKKSRKKDHDNDDDFIPSKELYYKDDDDDDDTSLCTTAVITGPVGCGKTAAVYALAREVGLKVLEINASNLRNNRAVLSRVQEATQSHLVASSSSCILSCTAQANICKQKDVSAVAVKRPSGSSLTKLFTPKSLSNISSKKNKLSDNAKQDEASRSDQMSLILFDEVEAVMEADRNFWSAVQSLMHSSKRPIIITSNTDFTLRHLHKGYQKIQFKSPSQESLSSYLQEVASKENVSVKKADCSSLVSLCGRDIRKGIMTLEFWATTQKQLHLNGEESEKKCGAKIASKSSRTQTTKLSDVFSKVCNISGHLESISDRDAHVPSFPGVFYNLANVDCAPMKSIETLFSDFYYHRFPPFLFNNRIELLPLFNAAPVSQEIHVASDFAAETKFSEDSEDEISLLSLSRAQKTISFNTLPLNSEQHSVSDANIHNISNTNNCNEPVDSRQRLHDLKALSEYFENISECDQLLCSYATMFNAIPHEDMALLHDGVLDNGGCMNEPSFNTETMFCDTQAFLQVHGLRKVQEDLREKESKQKTAFKYSSYEKRSAKWKKKLFCTLESCNGASISSFAFHTDYLPSLRGICRAENNRKQTRPSRRFFHYLEEMQVSQPITTRMAEEFKVVITSGIR
ncbi:unnamed protein product [Clavelina lepadiformis]|uniref:AAA+ ATPase domain-containing protein n=1 Tax=Clavelina lepadiformis TaxID=159417 RepID=A0ABP0GT42_CLALP